MYKPLIGITCNTMPASDVNVKNGIAAPGQDFQGLAVDYINALEKAGAIPVVLPVSNDLDGAKRIWERLDGILISGGHDVSPELYNESIKKECGALDHVRDTYEVAAARYFVAQNRPVLGICRGIQLLNAAFGGSNYQDLPSEGFERHTIIDGERNEPTHSVKIEKEGLLFEILQSEEIGVNSFHHQAVHRPAENMNVEAWSKDGVIEAVSVKNHPFALAVQWHPEMMFDSKQQFRVIQAFVHACGGKDLAIHSEGNITIRLENEKDYRAVEELTREAFWNVYKPGADEHYFVHMMRKHPDFIPKLAFVAEMDGKIIGNIMYTKAWLEDEHGDKKEILSFGPLCVAPAYQRQKIGKLLIEHSFDAARKMGYDVNINFGNPGNYVSRGFVSCKKKNVSFVVEGNFPTALLVCELVPGSLGGKKWMYIPSTAADCCEDAAAVEAFDATFSYKEKSWMPSQEEFYIYSHSSVVR